MPASSGTRALPLACIVASVSFEDGGGWRNSAIIHRVGDEHEGGQQRDDCLSALARQPHVAATIVRRMTLTEGNRPTGRTKHFYVSGIDKSAAVSEMPFLRVPVSPPFALMIVRFHDHEFNLIHLDQDGAELTDTYHETLADAQEQAQEEFSVRPDQWSIVNDPYSR